MPIAGDVWFSLNGTIYQNNSIVTLEDICEGDAALIYLIVADRLIVIESMETGSYPMKVEFPARVAIGTSTEPEVRVWYVSTAGEVEQKESIPL